MIALAILAAGESMRLGRAKQLLDLDGKPLIEHVIDAGLGSACDRVFVILGANYDEIHKAIQQRPVAILANPQWQSGMGSSIKAVVDHIVSAQSIIDSLILCTCDQPFLSAELFNQLISASSGTCKIVASKYANTIGVPALFKSEIFPELSSLDGTQGARKIIQKNIESVITIEFPEGAIDIDTEDDWTDFKRRRAALRSSSI